MSLTPKVYGLSKQTLMAFIEKTTSKNYYTLANGAFSTGSKKKGTQRLGYKVSGELISIEFDEFEGNYGTTERVNINLKDGDVTEVLQFNRDTFVTVRFARIVNQLNVGDLLEFTAGGSKENEKVSYLGTYKIDPATGAKTKIEVPKVAEKKYSSASEEKLAQAQMKVDAAKIIAAHPAFGGNAVRTYAGSSDEESKAEKDFWSVVDQLRLASHRQDEHAQVVLAYLDDQLGWDGIAWDSVTDQQFAEAMTHMINLQSRPNLPKALKAVQYPEKAKAYDPVDGAHDPFADE